MQIWLLIYSLSDFLQFNETIVGNNLWEQMTQMNTYMIQVEVLQATKKALATHGPQRHYRNECLCNAMVNFNMIDIVGRGIRKIFNEQWKRHFPMPDYEIDAANKEVTVRLYGNAINEKYTKLLKEKKDLTLEDCILLDAVQKEHRLNGSDAMNRLERGLVEGEYPDLTISLSIARQTKQLSEYTKVKGLERDKIKQMALQFIQNAGRKEQNLMQSWNT